MVGWIKALLSLFSKGAEVAGPVAEGALAAYTIYKVGEEACKGSLSLYTDMKTNKVGTYTELGSRINGVLNYVGSFVKTMETNIDKIPYVGPKVSKYLNEPLKKIGGYIERIQSYRETNKDNLKDLSKSLKYLGNYINHLSEKAPGRIGETMKSMYKVISGISNLVVGFSQAKPKTETATKVTMAMLIILIPSLMLLSFHSLYPQTGFSVAEAPRSLSSTLFASLIITVFLLIIVYKMRKK